MSDSQWEQASANLEDALTWIREAKAEAWDEDEQAGWLNNAGEIEPTIPLARNPYRSQV